MLSNAHAIATAPDATATPDTAAQRKHFDYTIINGVHRFLGYRLDPTTGHPTWG
jgi:hypothetical protein